MTVSELIEELKKCRQDSEVLTMDRSSGYFFDINGLAEHESLEPLVKDDAYRGQHVIELEWAI